jgi:hypothetical protein
LILILKSCSRFVSSEELVGNPTQYYGIFYQDV